MKALGQSGWLAAGAVAIVVALLAGCHGGTTDVQAREALAEWLDAYNREDEVTLNNRMTPAAKKQWWPRLEHDYEFRRVLRGYFVGNEERLKIGATGASFESMGDGQAVLLVPIERRGGGGVPFTNANERWRVTFSNVRGVWMMSGLTIVERLEENDMGEFVPPEVTTDEAVDATLEEAGAPAAP